MHDSIITSTKKYIGELLKIALIFFYFVLFSSIERSFECNRGYFLSLFFIVISPSRLACALFVAELVLIYNNMSHLSYICFFMIITRHFCGVSMGAAELANESSPDSVDFLPYETDIRKYLMRKDPSKLHLVDTMLKKYDYNGKELLRVLHDEYDERDLKEKAAFIRELISK